MSRIKSRRARLAATTAVLALGITPLTLAGVATATPGEAADAPSASADGDTAVRKGWKPLRLRILALNDFHGQLEVVPSSSSSGKIFTGPATTDFVPAGGAAYLGRHLRLLRMKANDAGAHHVTVAAGDLIGATPLLSAAFHDEPAIEAMNQVGLDIASVGNHEFDEGYKELLRMQRGGCLKDGAGANNQNSCPDPSRVFKGADFKYLGANVKYSKSGKTVFPGYTIKKYDGVKVGFIGMTLQDTPNIVTKAGVEGLRFTDEVKTVQRLMPVLRKKGVKSIVVLVHEGAVPTPTYEYDACPNITGPGVEIAKRLPAAVDVVVSGHTHQPYNCTVQDPAGRPRLLTSASSIGRMVTEIKLNIDRRTKNVIRPSASAQNHIVTNSDGTAAKSSILRLIDRYKTLVEPISNEVLGQIAPAGKNDLSRTASPDGGDSPVGNLIAESQLADASVIPTGGRAPQIAFMNPGGIRADLVENDNGDVTYGAAFAVQPFNNYVTSQTLTGQQVRAVLNEQWNGRNEGAANNKILQVAGLKYTWDRTVADATDADAIVGDILVAADPDGVIDDVLEPGTEYRIAVNSFLSDGGDGFATLGGGADKFFGGLDIDALASFLEANAPYEPTPLDRISNPLVP